MLLQLYERFIFPTQIAANIYFEFQFILTPLHLPNTSFFVFRSCRFVLRSSISCSRSAFSMRFCFRSRSSSRTRYTSGLAYSVITAYLPSHWLQQCKFLHSNSIDTPQMQWLGCTGTSRKRSEPGVDVIWYQRTLFHDTRGVADDRTTIHAETRRPCHKFRPGLVTVTLTAIFSVYLLHPSDSQTRLLICHAQRLVHNDHNIDTCSSRDATLLLLLFFVSSGVLRRVS